MFTQDQRQSQYSKAEKKLYSKIFKNALKLSYCFLILVFVYSCGRSALSLLRLAALARKKSEEIADFESLNLKV